MRKPISPAPSQPEEILPHDHDREARQPYAKEVEDYQAGVVTPPEEQAGRDRGPGSKVAEQATAARAGVISRCLTRARRLRAPCR